jgi:hypothetical protein
MKLLPHLPAYETQDVRPLSVVLTVAGLFASLILSFAIVAGILVWLRPVERSMPATETGQLRIGPRLQVDPKQDARRLNEAAFERLQGYGWSDRKAGVAHIPISRAIALLAERGWPDPDAGGARP